MQENWLNKFRTIVSEVSSLACNPVFVSYYIADQTAELNGHKIFEETHGLLKKYVLTLSIVYMKNKNKIIILSIVHGISIYIWRICLVHGLCGVWGMLAVGLFAAEDTISEVITQLRKWPN